MRASGTGRAGGSSGRAWGGAARAERGWRIERRADGGGSRLARRAILGPMRAPTALLRRLPPTLDVALRTSADGVDAAALSPEECARMGAFAHPDRRQAFGLGRMAAHALVARHLGEGHRIEVAPDGALSAGGRALSLAHTGRGEGAMAVAALAHGGGRVGVDLERIAPRRPDLWQRLLHPDERDLLDALGGPTDAAQTLLWTLKEAVLKAERTGLRAGLRSVRLALDGATPGAGTAAGPSRGGWRLAWGDAGGAWLAVAWADEA